jgi:hypothetical protein
MMVSELSKKAEEFPEYTDDLYNAYQGMPDFEEAALQNGWTQKKNGKFYNKENKETSDAETFEALCEEQNIDAYEYAGDIYEHWIVSDFLADKLENHGHRVLKDFFGMTIWCRPTTGQAILLDYVISAICEEMEILDGQKYSWKEK